MITLEDYLMRRDIKYPLTDEQMGSALDFVSKVQKLEFEYGQPLTLTSGYRPRAVTETICGAHHGDAHERCAGGDFRDLYKELSMWCLKHLDVLEAIGLWMESPECAKDHVHLQAYAPKSGHRVFIA